MSQTAIIIRVEDVEVLVRIDGIHVPDEGVKVDWRPYFADTSTWTPYTGRVEVRREGTGQAGTAEGRGS
jgi:hypothetical protein